MTAKQRLQIRRSEIRSRMGILAALEGEAYGDPQRVEVRSLTGELDTLEEKYRLAVISEGETAEARESAHRATDGEGAELRSLARRVHLGEYLAAASEGRAVEGAEAEYNAALKTRRDRFPLRLLAPAVEARATTNADGEASQGRWLDRLFATSAASHLGVTFESAAPGLKAYPLVSAGASPEQQDRSESTGAAAWTVSSVEAKPKRNSARVVISQEDNLRLPGLESALRRDLAMAVSDAVDRAVFLGDSGPSTASYDIVGLNTAANVAHVDLTQANKVLFPQTMDAFNGFVDGIHASRNEDLNVVAAVGAHRLWCRTLPVTNESASMKDLLARAGISWMVRGNIETNTANDDWGAFIGRGRGIEGAAVAVVWAGDGMLIRDPFTEAAKGELALNLSYYWDFKTVRSSSFGRLQFSS